MLDTKLFEAHNNIGVLIFSFKYIQNTEQQIDQLQTLFNDLNKGTRS